MNYYHDSTDSDIVVKFKKKYSYLNLTDEKLNKIVSKINKKDAANCFALVEEKLLDMTKKLIKSNQDDDQVIKYIINEYINNNIVIHKNNYNRAVFCLRDLVEFFSRIDFDLEPEGLCELLKVNKVLSNALDIVVKKNIDAIKDGRLEDVFYDSTILSMIEGYCDLNNIPVGKKEKEEKETIKFDEEPVTSNSLSIYLRDIRKFKLLTPDEQRELALKTMQGDIEAKTKFYESNLRLVVSIAIVYYARYREKKIHILDLIQEGNIGLLVAVEKYNPMLGYRFSTYATWWVRSFISKYVRNTKIIKIPDYTQRNIFKYKEVVDDIYKSEGRVPSIEEVATIMDIPIKSAIHIYTSNYLDSVDTLDQKISEKSGNDELLVNRIPSNEESVEDTVIHDGFSEELELFFRNECKFSKRDIEIIWHRYGFGGRYNMLFEEIGNIYGISRQRVQQIDDRILRVLRSKAHLVKVIFGIEEGTIFENAVLANNKRKKSKDVEPASEEKEVVSETAPTEVLETVVPLEKKISIEKLKDYYGYFLKFTKSDLIRYAYNEVDYVFDNILLPRERDIIQRIYGKSLRDDYCTNNVEPYEEEYYQRVIVPKMIRNIQSLNINNRGDINTNNMTPLILQRR